MQGSYDLGLVLASYCVAVIAAFSAIYFGTRVRDLTQGSQTFLFTAGTLCLGTGIWSMHFVGMSAYEMPMDMEMSFDLTLTALSFVFALGASALGMWGITRQTLSVTQLAASALVMGLGIFTMHYCGMFAMQMNPPIQYDSAIVFASGLVAVAASGAALVICRNIGRVPARYSLVVRASAALVMGVAVCGMHYTGMAAISLPMDASMPADNLLRGNWMGTPTALAASVFLLLLVYIAYQDFREMERARKAEQEAADAARQAAFSDAQTGLPNRAALEEELVSMIQQEQDSRFTLLYLEMKEYRQISKQHGDTAARDYTGEFIHALQHHLPQSAYLARYNSNGFMVLLADTPPDSLVSLAERISGQLTRSPEATLRGATYRFGIGYCHYPKYGTIPRLLIRQAQVIKVRLQPTANSTEYLEAAVGG